MRLKFLYIFKQQHKSDVGVEMRFQLYFRNAQRLWDQFCEYTELPGFRFMTSKVALLIRLAATITFVCSLFAMGVQLWYLIGQYLRNTVQTSSRKYRIQKMALPIVYLCNRLNGSHPTPLLDLCLSPVFEHDSPNLADTEEMIRVVPFCSYQIKLINYKCELRCKWSSQGFCIEARINPNKSATAAAFIENGSALQKNNTDTAYLHAHEEENFQMVTDYDIKIYFNSTVSPDATPETLSLALVFLRFASDAIKWPTLIPLVGAAHMIMERDALNIIQVVETLKITKNELPDILLAPVNSSFEYCVWKTNSELQTKHNGTCSSEFITNIFARNYTDFIDTTYGVSECAMQRALTAQQQCPEDKEFNRFTVESTMFTRSVADMEGLDPFTSPNLRIYPTDVVMQETLHQPRSAGWKMLSELGGTMALYLGFTLMSLLEAMVFFMVAHVRKLSKHLDQESQVLRKNPPIKKNVTATVVGMASAARKVTMKRRVAQAFVSTG